MKTNLLHIGKFSDMDDERIKTGSLLNFENEGYGFGVEGIRPEPVDRLRRESHDPPFLNEGCRFLYRLRLIPV